MTDPINDQSVSKYGRGKSERVDLGLALLRIAAVPGVCCTAREISAWCGCYHGAIQRIERNALKKLRNRMQFQHDPLLNELVQLLFECERRPAKMRAGE